MFLKCIYQFNRRLGFLTVNRSIQKYFVQNYTFVSNDKLMIKFDNRTYPRKFNKRHFCSDPLKGDEELKSILKDIQSDFNYKVEKNENNLEIKEDIRDDDKKEDKNSEINDNKKVDSPLNESIFENQSTDIKDTQNCKLYYIFILQFYLIFEKLSREIFNSGHFKTKNT